jgi:hypothetical protein
MLSVLRLNCNWVHRMKIEVKTKLQTGCSDSDFLAPHRIRFEIDGV